VQVAVHFRRSIDFAQFHESQGSRSRTARRVRCGPARRTRTPALVEPVRRRSRDDRHASGLWHRDTASTSRRRGSRTTSIIFNRFPRHGPSVRGGRRTVGRVLARVRPSPSGSRHIRLAVMGGNLDRILPVSTLWSGRFAGEPIASLRVRQVAVSRSAAG
jgi:hypothetical protein